MSDLWELENGLDPLVKDAEEDPDGDSYSNLDEFLMGTNPLVAESEGIPTTWLILTPVGLIAVAAFVYLRVREKDY